MKSAFELVHCGEDCICERLLWADNDPERLVDWLALVRGSSIGMRRTGGVSTNSWLFTSKRKAAFLHQGVVRASQSLKMFRQWLVNAGYRIRLDQARSEAFERMLNDLSDQTNPGISGRLKSSSRSFVASRARVSLRALSRDRLHQAAWVVSGAS